MKSVQDTYLLHNGVAIPCLGFGTWQMKEGPETVAAHEAVIAQDLKEILASHGLSGKDVRIRKRERPLTLTEVFPDLFEGKRSVNVKV